MCTLHLVQQGLDSVLKEVGMVSYPTRHLSKVPFWLQTISKAMNMTCVSMDSLQMNPWLLHHTFSFELVFLSPEKWYLNRFLSGAKSSSSGRMIGSPKLVFLNPSRGLPDEFFSSSFTKRPKSLVNFFSCFLQISVWFEDTADDTNGHFISLKTDEKSL